MKLTRTQKREAAFLLLYQKSQNDDTVEEIIQANIEEFDLQTDITVTATVMAVLDYAEKADEIINRFSKTRKVERIAKVSVAIMRLALYEMNCIDEDDVPDKTAINEAVELSKKYAGEKDRKFINGLLGSYYREKHEQ